MNRQILAGTFGALACLSTACDAAVLTRSFPAAVEASLVAPAQYWGWRRPYWRGPYWYHRPWYRRPYYGTIVAGVALGALITVAVVGRVPPRPAPNLCWYWADPYRNRGYWDYCY
jgi:hypothetical protein